MSFNPGDNTGTLGQGGLKTVSSNIDPPIPDSALLQYPFGERSDSTLVEELEGADGTANGITNVSGNWYGGFAESGDGSSDYGDLTDWSVVNFGANLNTDFSIAVTIQSTNSAVPAFILGTTGVAGGETTAFSIQLGASGDAGVLQTQVVDTNDNAIRVKTDSNRFNDGSKYRVVVVKRGNTASDLEIWVSGSQESTTIVTDQTLGTTNNLPVAVYSHARNNQGTPEFYLDAIIDNIIPTDAALSSQEITGDYNAQPWS